MLRFAPGEDAAEFTPHLTATAHIDDELVGLVDVEAFRVERLADGPYQTPAIPIVFVEDVASACVDADATVAGTLSRSSRTGSSQVEVRLVDDG